METSNPAGSPAIYSLPSLEGEGPITAALVAEWLQADQVAASLLQGYLAARKLGVECPQGRKNGDYSGLALNIKDNYG